MIFFKRIFFQTILVSKDVEFNEKLHKHLLCFFVIFDKKPYKIPLWSCKYNFRNIFLIENLSDSNFGTNSFLLKRRIDWYINLSFI